MTNPIHIHQYDNGLVLIAQHMEGLESAAFSLLLPAGCCHDPSRLLGLSNFACEMTQRGCGPRDSRQFVNDLENLGVDYSASVANAHTMFGGAMLSEQLERTIPIYADLVQRPHLPPSQLDDARLACVQEIHALHDDLAQRAMLELRYHQYGDPFGRYSQGSLESIQEVGLAHIQEYVRAHYRPNGTILSAAGKIDFPRLRDQVGELFAGWRMQQPPRIVEATSDRSYVHIPHESNQTHIAVAYPSVHYGDPGYYQARGAVGVLSDGMSARLFTELRENRGLCYAVYAACHTVKRRGCVMCYAGTTTERAQETLDVLLNELRKLESGVQPDELQRVKARLKSGLLMQQESSASRSGSIAADWYHLNRVQTLEELGHIVDGLTCESINQYLAEHPPTDFVVVTLGRKPLEMPR
ncbi:MAG: M16 family metallopeptidase [Planctomycetota bacterium]